MNEKSMFDIKIHFPQHNQTWGGVGSEQYYLTLLTPDYEIEQRLTKLSLADENLKY